MLHRWLIGARNAGRYFTGWRPWAERHFSQEGEDLVLARLFGSQRRGSYVDVGAHDAFRFSNTRWAYERGWSGVAIDPSARTARSFRKFRPRDTFVRACIAEERGEVPLHVFNERALNTSSDARKQQLASSLGLVSREEIVPALPLSEVLDSVWGDDSGTTIDFMSIDVEGSEMAVLRSNNWDRFSPRVVVVEVLGLTLAEIRRSPEVCFLHDLGYIPVSMLYHSVVLVSDHQLLQVHWGSG